MSITIQEMVESMAGIGPDGHPPADSSADIRGHILKTVRSKDAPFQKNQAIADAVISALLQAGRLFYHAEFRDFESAMFFNSRLKRLERIRSDSFLSWISEWLAVNRADNLFRHIQAAVETASLGKSASAILPAAYWQATPGSVYLSNGDGQIVRITLSGWELCDNGTDGVLFAAGKTLRPWNVEAFPEDPFETCRLFREARSAAAHGKDLLRAWTYSLPTTPRCKPPLCLSGEIGSGKTRWRLALPSCMACRSTPKKSKNTASRTSGRRWTLAGLFVSTMQTHAPDGCPTPWLVPQPEAASDDGNFTQTLTS